MEDIAKLLKRLDELSKQIDSLEENLKNTREENKRLKEIISTYNKNFLQRAKVMSGEKIAERKDVDIEKIKELEASGLNHSQIARELKCSRSTIWRRLRYINSEII